MINGGWVLKLGWLDGQGEAGAISFLVDGTAIRRMWCGARRAAAGRDVVGGPEHAVKAGVHR